MGVLVSLPQATGVAGTLIIATAMTDQEVADALSAALRVPIRSGLVRLWREEALPDPAQPIMECLAGLKPPAPPAAVRLVS